MRLTAHGSADPDEVWDRYVHPQRWPEWSPQIRAVDTAAARLAPGVVGQVVGPFGVRTDFTVEELDDTARTWSWRVCLGPIRLLLHHKVLARRDGTTTWVDVRGPLPVVVAYAPLAQLAIHRLVSDRPLVHPPGTSPP